MFCLKELFFFQSFVRISATLTRSQGAGGGGHAEGVAGAAGDLRLKMQNI